MEDFFDRLDKYIENKGLNDNQMTVKAGLSIGSLGKQRKGSRGLSNDSIAKILLSYSDLSADWLLTGRGDMIVENSLDMVNESSNIHRRISVCEKCKLKDELIESLRREIDTQGTFIKFLQEKQ